MNDVRHHITQVNVATHRKGDFRKTTRINVIDKSRVQAIQILKLAIRVKEFFANAQDVQVFRKQDWR